jgi:exopolysaccharide biosynthesis polyprenyl glycosylphosphotransferase
MRRFRRDAEARGLSEAIQEAPVSAEEVEVRDRRYRRSLAFSDALAASAGLVLIGVIGPHGLAPLALFVPVLVVAIAKLQGLYDRDELLIHKTTIDEAPRLFQLATVTTLLFWMLSDELLTGWITRTQAGALWIGLFTTSLLGRRLARVLIRRAVATERCLFVGDACSYERLGAKFESTDVHAELVGRMNLQRGTRPVDDAAHRREISELIRWARAHRLIIEPQALDADEALDLVRAAKAVGVRVSLLPRILDVVGTSVVFDQLDGMTVLGVRRFGLSRSSRMVKRTFDLVGATMILALIAPLMTAIALAIRIDSRGPVFFRQERVGRNGRRFRIFKFRTMGVGADALKAELRVLNEANGLFKIADDPRITNVGRFLRRTSLDELPQLFNVLTADMSLVGPRPLVVDEDEQITGWDRRRLQLTPGMTGHWQIAGSSRVPMHEMVKIDYLYVAGWSLWEDLKILLRTVPYVLSRRGL